MCLTIEGQPFEDVGPFFYWINERHRIYLKKEAGEKPPWTDNAILRDYRFCNVFRELDTVTIWIRQNLREPLADHPLLWFWSALARNVNWPGALEEYFDRSEYFPNAWDAAEFIDIIGERKARGDKCFSSAYVITNGGTTLKKEEFVAHKVMNPLWAQNEFLTTWFNVPGRSLELAWTKLRNFNGFGPFIAYEVITDLRHTRYLREASDIMSWANAGPGALRGLNRLLGRAVKTPLDARKALGHMQCLLASANAGNGLVGGHVPLPLEMRDVEHSLCETDKYLRAKTGEGRPKTYYDWQKYRSI